MALQLQRPGGERFLPTLLSDLEQLFEDRLRPLAEETATSGWAPRIDMEETEDSYVVHAELPGVEVDDISVSIDDDLLTVRGERHFYEEREEQGFTRRERRFGSFYRALRLPLPIDADAIEARQHNGVLTITVPKTEDTRSRRIEVTPE